MAKLKLKGEIISVKMDKTAVVKVGRLFMHPKYKKYVRRHKNYKAHNENNQYKEKELVIIKETKPISKQKKFIIVDRLQKQEKKDNELKINEIEKPINNQSI